MRPRGRSARRRQRGQALVEFSLIIPIFMMLVVAIMEFGFLLTIKIGVTDSAQDGVQLASQLGNNLDADFSVLQLVEKDISSPMDRSKIMSVEIIKTDAYGLVNLGEDKFTRTGTYWNQALTDSVPYTRTTSTYLPQNRCNVLSGAGCPASTTIDYVAVKITYQYSWVTPLPNLAGLGSTAPTFVQSSVSRMEPVQ
jgi:Flp pilus assembly protein TadG